MPSGYRVSDDLRAKAVALVLSGTSVSEAARQCEVDRSMVSRWVTAHTRLTGARRATPRLRARARDPWILEGLIFDYVEEIITTLRLQLRFTTEQNWLAKQNAGDLAALVGTERDSLLRLLAGFKPVEPGGDGGQSQPAALEAAAAPDPADD